MQETAFILGNAGSGSLVIIDELGRGTGTRGGLAIALAVCAALIESRALVWFATHFRDLARILENRAGVINLHLQVEVSILSHGVYVYQPILHLVAHTLSTTAFLRFLKFL
jgi:DNA mismatch repair protein MSH4